MSDALALARHCHDIRDGKTQAQMRAEILAIEAAMMAMPEHQIEFPVTHHFSPGVYMREMFIPKGATLTGKIHKTEHLNILSQGDLSVWTESGIKRLKASSIVKSLPGSKRVGHAHEDSVWTTVHHNPDNDTDIEKIEHRLVINTFCSANDSKIIDYLTSKQTYADAILVLGMTHDQAWGASINEADQIPFQGDPGASVGPSSLHGQGLFAARRFSKGEVMFPCRIDGKRTPGGRYCNHSSDPNSEMVMCANGDVGLIAVRTIEPGEEITNDYFFNYVNTRPGRVPWSYPPGLIGAGQSKKAESS